MKYLYMNEQERQMQYYQFPKFLLELQLSEKKRYKNYSFMFFRKKGI